LKTENLHPWNVSPREAIEIQTRLSKQVSLAPNGRQAKWIGGGDVAYAKEGDRLFGAMVVLSLPDLIRVDEAWAVGRIRFPYVPGLLSFRESPILIEVAEKIQPRPDVWIFDGQGIAHPRGFGLASHMGLMLDCPSIGCAKKRLVGAHGAVGPRRGDGATLTWDERVVGAAVRTRPGTKPVYVSPGFRIDLESAVRLVVETSRPYRIPEPLRQAHLLSNRIRREEDGERLA
jgi:deoxyribonuclease V